MMYFARYFHILRSSLDLDPADTGEATVCILSSSSVGEFVVFRNLSPLYRRNAQISIEFFGDNVIFLAVCQRNRLALFGKNRIIW